MIHTISPFLFKFTSNSGLDWYSFSYFLSFVAAFLIIIKLNNKKNVFLKSEQIVSFSRYAIFGVLVGGRIGYALFYDHSLFYDFRASFPFHGLIALWEGGMSSHGGFIGVSLSCLVFSKKNKISFFKITDLLSIPACLGLFIGRLANFMNGELVGKATHVSWGVKFPKDIFTWIKYSPEKLETLAPAVRHLNIPSERWSTWIEESNFNSITNVCLRVMNAVYDGNESVIKALSNVLEQRHPSQIYAAFSEGFIPFIILIIIFNYKKYIKGFSTGLFLVLYSIGRLFNEIFRRPDLHLGSIENMPLSISRGQFLSLFLLLLGLVIIFRNLNQNLLKQKSL